MVLQATLLSTPDTLPPPTIKFGYLCWLRRKVTGFRCACSELLWRIWTPDLQNRFIISIVALVILFALFWFEFIKLGAKGVELATPGSSDWQVLARWIVIMTEWPKSSYTLSRYPGLADIAVGLEASGELPPNDKDVFVMQIKANSPVMNLLTFKDADKGWLKRDITAAEIDWLRILIPPTSGRFLDISLTKLVKDK